MEKRRSASRYILFILLAVVLLLGITTALVFQGGSYEPKTTASLSAFDRIKSAVESGTEIILTKEDLNDLAAVYFKKGKKFGPAAVNAVYTDLKGNQIYLYIPVQWKGLKITLATHGRLSYGEDKLIYTPVSFQVGKLPLPGKFTLSLLQKYGKDFMEVSKNHIAVKNQFLPFDITNMKVQDSKLIVTFKKITLRDLLSGLKGAVSGTEVKTEKEAEKAISSKNNVNESTSKITNKSEAAQNQKNLGQNKNTSTISTTVLELQKVSSQLGSVLKDVNTEKQQQIINIMQATMSQLSANPSYAYREDAAKVKSIYNTLKAEEKKQLKEALFSNVDIRSAIQLKNTFGL